MNIICSAKLNGKCESTTCGHHEEHQYYSSCDYNSCDIVCEHTNKGGEVIQGKCVEFFTTNKIKLGKLHKIGVIK